MGQEPGHDLPRSSAQGPTRLPSGIGGLHFFLDLWSSCKLPSLLQNLVLCSCRTEGPIFLPTVTWVLLAVPCRGPPSGPLTALQLLSSRPAETLSREYDRKGDIYHLFHSLSARSQSEVPPAPQGEGLFNTDSLGSPRFCLSYSQVLDHSQHATTFQSLPFWDLGCWPKWGQQAEE